MPGTFRFTSNADYNPTFSTEIEVAGLVPGSTVPLVTQLLGNVAVGNISTLTPGVMSYSIAGSLVTLPFINLSPLFLTIDNAGYLFDYTGGSGAATFVGGNFGDILISSAFADTLSGGGGADYLAGGAGADTIDGGDGADTISYATSSAAVSVNLTTGIGVGGDAQGDVIRNVEHLVGSIYDDVLIGSAADNILLGGLGDDYLVGGAGADYIDGGDGPDTVSYATSSAAVNVNLATGLGSGGDAQGDVILNVSRLVGSNFDDVLIGDATSNTLLGGAGDDYIVGGGGADYMDGGDGPNTVSYASSLAGVIVNLASGTGTGGDAEGDILLNFQRLVGSSYNDILVGDAGNNVLIGGLGRDSLIGGGGADTFVFTSYADTASADPFYEVIHDFSRDEGDVINLSAIDPSAADGDQAFTFVGTAAFIANGIAQLRYTELGTVAPGANGFLVQADSGDGNADMSFVVVSSAASLIARDFIL